MLISINDKVRESAIQELIGYCVIPDPERIENAIRLYEADSGHELFGFEEEGAIVGIVGIIMDEHNGLTVKHIAVEPESRGQGYGRDMMLALIELKNPQRITAETDEEAVDFYRNIGFTIESLGEKYPGIERFQCTYLTELNDE